MEESDYCFAPRFKFLIYFWPVVQKVNKNIFLSIALLTGPEVKDFLPLKHHLVVIIRNFFFAADSCFLKKKIQKQPYCS